MDAHPLKKRGRKTPLHTLQIAVGRADKENLTRKRTLQKKEMKQTKIDNDKIGKKVANNTNKTEGRNQKNKVKSETVTSETNVTKPNNTNIPLIAEDLTSEIISDNYWKHLAESRRVALDSTLKENVDLHNKVTELEYENTKLKELLEEAKTLVKVLTEMLDEGESNTEAGEVSQLDEKVEGTEESDLDDVSFRSWV